MPSLSALKEWDAAQQMPAIVREEVLASPDTKRLVSEALKAYKGGLEGMVLHGDWVKGRAGRGAPIEIACIVNSPEEQWALDFPDPPAWNGRPVVARTILMEGSADIPYLWYELAEGEGVVLYDKAGRTQEQIDIVRRRIDCKAIQRVESRGETLWRIDESKDWDWV